MNTAPVAKAHFVLGGVHVDIDQCGIELQVEHKSRVTTVKQHVAVCLAHRMGDKAIANIATVHIEVLQVRLTARKSRQATQPHRRKPIAERSMNNAFSINAGPQTAAKRRSCSS